MRAPALLPAFALLAACSGNSGQADKTAEPAEAAPAASPQPADPDHLLALSDRDCAVVANFYLDAVSAGRFRDAALVWAGPEIDDRLLEARFSDYAEPQFTMAEPMTEGAAGSLYCTIDGVLTDAADPSMPESAGQLVLRRVNDVPGATPQQLRWTLRSSTFIEPLERAAGSPDA
ncbi:hypothetical protein FHS61_001249 [Altererythrobacter atlanticus]|uniref:Uncharacterized protein n=1 Tax=Croceibacterium atlanticum TaxID=1267766 RepID=A0A0F7KUY8_9SPHN|nr:hypothetical protein [Croceibacterium atlanticum]AKH43052.1 hypothetical protein WYH_02018 [Croceibacterium atlanticum]MBB5732245.1 hypothetical protein [Croceibacterium atlanticum]